MSDTPGPIKDRILGTFDTLDEALDEIAAQEENLRRLAYDRIHRVYWLPVEIAGDRMPGYRVFLGQHARKRKRQRA